MSCQSHWLTSFFKNILYKQLINTWKTLLAVDNYHAVSSFHIFRLFLPPRLFLVFFNPEFSSPQIIKTVILMEKSENKKVRVTELSNTIYSSGFLNWLTWRSTPCVVVSRWSQSRNCHNRKVWRTYFLNTVFLRSFLIWLTSRGTPYFPS